MKRKEPLNPSRSPLRLFLSIILLTTLLCHSASALVETGGKYLPFKGKDLKNKTVNIDDYIGKKIVLIKFGSIYCSTCVSMLQDIRTLIREVGSKNLQVIGVNLDVYGIYRVKRFYRGYERLITYPMVIDSKLGISSLYNIQSLPAHVVIDKKGIIRYISSGVTEGGYEDLKAVVTKLVRGEKGIERYVKKDPLQIFLPQNFSKTMQDSIYIVGQSEYKRSDVVLTLNGGSKQVINPMRNLFYIRTPLSLGSNYIEVKVNPQNGKKVQKGIVLFREPKIGMGIESPFPEYSFHTELNEKPCRKCHDMDPPVKSKKGFLVASQFCLNCHKELQGKKFVHGPIPVGGCSPCHDFSSQPNRYQIVARGQELCFNCHENKKKELLREYLHGPLSAGICTVCHDPHGSNEKFQLRKYVGDLCVMCHADFKTEMYRASVHKPFQDGQCSDCHFAHSSDRKDFFVRLPGNDLCLSCHDNTMGGHLHPYGRPPKRELNVKFDKEGNLVCISCHNPHASDDVKMLPKGGCAYCHNG